MVHAGLVAGVWPGNERSPFKFLGPVEDLLESCWTPPSRRVQESAKLKVPHNGFRVDRFYQKIPDAPLPNLLISKARPDPYQVNKLAGEACSRIGVSLGSCKP